MDIWTQFWSWPLTTMEIWRRALETPPVSPKQSDAARWSCPAKLQLDLPIARLWEFSSARSSTSALVVAPYALHDAQFVDLAPGHSLVAALLRAAPRRLCLAEWKSADATTQNFGIDELLATLNVLVDEIGAPVDLIGLCQGGWLSLLYAARFPQKVRCIVVAGAPVDVRAASSAITASIEKASDAQIDHLIDMGGGRVRGARMATLWPREETREERLVGSLEIAPPFDGPDAQKAIAAFDAWDAHTLDLPGPYYRQVITQLYRQNNLAEGRFPALGRLVDLRTLRQPLHILVGDRDAIAPPAQALAAARLVSGPVETTCAPCGHLALFIGRHTLDTQWPRIAQWLPTSEAPT